MKHIAGCSPDGSSVFVTGYKPIRLGQIRIVIDYDMLQRFDRATQVFASTVQAFPKFVVRYIVPTLCSPHRHSLYRRLNVRNRDKDQNNFVAVITEVAKKTHFIANRIRQYGFKNKATAAESYAPRFSSYARSSALIKRKLVLARWL